MGTGSSIPCWMSDFMAKTGRLKPRAEPFRQQLGFCPNTIPFCFLPAKKRKQNGQQLLAVVLFF